MAYERDEVEFPLPAQYFEQRMAAGWTLRAIEWEQDRGGSNEAEGVAVPYGMKVAPETLELKQHPGEMAVLLAILEMIVRDRSVPIMAEDLNLRGFRTRAGGSWSAPAVFDLLPRVIEMGPTLLRSSEWISRRITMQPG